MRSRAGKAGAFSPGCLADGPAGCQAADLVRAGGGSGAGPWGCLRFPAGAAPPGPEAHASGGSGFSAGGLAVRYGYGAVCGWGRSAAVSSARGRGGDGRVFSRPRAAAGAGFSGLLGADRADGLPVRAAVSVGGKNFFQNSKFPLFIRAEMGYNSNNHIRPQIGAAGKTRRRIR